MKNNVDDSLIYLLGKLARSGNGAFYTHEQLITYPAINQAINLINGIKLLSENNNFIGVIALTRGLIEVVMVFVYDCTASKEKDFYDQFMENGRIMKWSEVKNKWEKLRDDDLIKHFELVTKHGIRQFYDNCCDVLHFSVAQTKMIISPSVQEDGLFDVKVGECSINVPREKYDEIINFTNDCENIIKKYLREMIVKKNCKTKKNKS